MKAKHGWLDQWQTEADEGMPVWKALVTALVFIVLIGAFLADVLLIWAAMQ